MNKTNTLVGFLQHVLQSLAASFLKAVSLASMKMFDLFALLFLLPFLPSILFAQSTNHILLEAGGYGIHYSVNYQRVFAHSYQTQFEGRIGTCILPIGIGIPAALSLAIGPSPHRLQASIGGNVFIDRRQVGGTDTFLYLGAGMGYRYEPGNQQWFLYATINPMLKTDPTPNQLIDPEPVGMITGGLGLGWKLNK